MAGFKLDGEEYFLEYEGLHMLCINCGIYGHATETCPRKTKETDKEGEENSKKTGKQDSRMKNITTGAHDNYHDQWHVVQKGRRQRKIKENREYARQGIRGSRYDVLGEEKDQQQGERSIEEIQVIIIPQVQDTLDARGTLVASSIKDRKKRDGQRTQPGRIVVANKEERSAVLMGRVESIIQKENLKEKALRKRAEKRTLEMRNEMKSGEILMITAGESNEGLVEESNDRENQMETDLMKAPVSESEPNGNVTKKDELLSREIEPGDMDVEGGHTGDPGEHEVGLSILSLNCSVYVDTNQFEDSMVPETPVSNGL